VLRPGMELLLFRLGDRGYACPRERVHEVIDVGTGQPAVPGLPSSSLGALGGGERPVALVSLRLTSACPTAGPRDASWSSPPATAPSGSWSTRSSA
jgi:chemotaxis signal transduction protein